ncbi:MAG: FAD-binding protein [Clostridia bacterium]|nr:FAD-binding protein [Clostridia bacterium]
MKNISRRSFLKGGVAMGALAAMGGATIASAEETYTYADTIKWDAQYDVVALGMGFAGMTAAMYAADAGASVLVAEKMSEALAGGNSKVAGQLFAYGAGDYEATNKYYHQLAGGRQVPEEMLQVIINGVTNMWDKLKDWLFDGDDSQFMNWTGVPIIGEMSPEYPEFEGSDKISLCTTHMGVSDSFLYSTVKAKMLERKDKIDVWFESPAVELIQDPATKTVLGVKIERKGEVRNVRALNGVVVATGGFECDRQMVQEYLNMVNYAPIGGQFNTGDGIKMCQAVGAQLWHMYAYEGGFGVNSCGYAVEPGSAAVQAVTLAYNSMSTGAMVIVGTEGERFGNESEIPRHGHLYDNGIWENPHYPNKIHMIFDQTQLDQMKADGTIREEFVATLISAATIEELSDKIGTVKERLVDTIESFNFFAENGKDYNKGRKAEYMRKFDGTMYYAMPMNGLILNTQGGPKRNPNAEVLDMDGNPIPHLYSAGEMGGITSCMYQGGTNIDECFIFGEIAGKNAAAAKEALPAYTAAAKVESNPLTLGMDTDVGAEKTYEAGENQFVGTGKGMMGDVAVRVTMADGKISVVEVLEQNETPAIAGPALEQLPGKFVGCATAEEIDAVDGISGATLTSNALKTAVKAALAQAK